MRTPRLLLPALVMTACLQSPVRPEAPAGVPEPKFDRVDYTRPRDYVDVGESLGNPDRIRATAEPLKADSPERTLLAIGRWVDAHLTCDNAAAYAWRDFDRVVDSKVYGGCADHALVFGALARACGIPTVWVKTMDADWVREFVKAGTCTSWRGHVFLEVHLGGRWRLLDAQALRLYDDYEPSQRVLPGGRFAYDKGGDPKALVLSTDWERWKAQTSAYFARFDVSRLPVVGGRRLGTVYVAADSPVWQAIERRFRSLGRDVFSFNTDFERFLPESRGGDLVVTCVGDRPVLPEPFRAGYLPVPMDDLRARMAHAPSGVLRKRLDDGTRLTLVYGKDIASVLRAVDGLDLEPPG